MVFYFVTKKPWSFKLQFLKLSLRLCFYLIRARHKPFDLRKISFFNKIKIAI